MRILVAMVILNEMIMRWVTLFWIGQASLSTWSDIASVAVPFGAKAVQSAFERPWGAPPGPMPVDRPPFGGSSLGGGDL